MKIELHDDTVDGMVRDVLRQQIKICKANIKNLKKQSKLKDFEAEDLGNNIHTLAALETVYDYFGGDKL
jgi:hypothetical protein